MKLENLDQAMRYKERREKLLEMKSLLESNVSSIWIMAIAGTQMSDKHVSIHDDCLTAIVCKYCEDTIRLIEDAIEKL